ncbi:hypothetical protein IJ425_08475, partial [bacterium]|nr:hypothetical protein [bacterium]
LLYATSCLMLVAMFCLPIIFIRIKNYALATLLYGFSGIFALMFLLLAFFFIIKIFKFKPCMVIDEYAIHDFFTINKIGQILFYDISSIRLDKFGGMDLLVIRVNDRDKYKNRGKFAFLNRINKDVANDKILIPLALLKIKGEELESVANSYFENYKINILKKD